MASKRSVLGVLLALAAILMMMAQSVLGDLSSVEDAQRRDLQGGCLLDVNKIAQRRIKKWNARYYTLRDPRRPRRQEGNGPLQWRPIDRLKEALRTADLGDCGPVGKRWLAWVVPHQPVGEQRFLGACLSKHGTTRVWHPTIAVFDCNANLIKCGDGVIGWTGEGAKQDYLVVAFAVGVNPKRYWLEYGGGAVRRTYHCDYWDYT